MVRNKCKTSAASLSDGSSHTAQRNREKKEAQHIMLMNLTNDDDLTEFNNPLCMRDVCDLFIFLNIVGLVFSQA